MTRRLLTLQFIVLFFVASPAWAQAPRASGPFAGLFGGRSQATHALDFRGSLFAANQKVLVPAEEKETVSLDPRFQRAGTFGGASGSLAYSYSRSANGSGFFVSGRGSISDYSARPDVPDVGFGVEIGASTKLTRRIDFSTSARTGYSPFFNFASATNATGFDPTFAASTTGFDPTFGIPSFGFATVAARNIAFEGGVGLSSSLTRRSSVSVQGSWRENHLLDSGGNDTASYAASATFSHRLTRTLGFHVGYGRALTQYLGSAAESTRSGSFDIGLDYGDGLTVPLGRRTTLSFSSGASVVSSGGRPHFRLNGSVGIARPIGRTWSASAGYVRSMGFAPGSIKPILSDSVSASFGGLLAPRLSWNSGASWSRGVFGFDTSDHFTSRSATTGVSFGIFRSLGTYAQYTYHRDHIPPGSTTLDVFSNFGRQTVSVGLSLWVPIFNNGKGRS